jgi:hypothetical protein
LNRSSEAARDETTGASTPERRFVTVGHAITGSQNTGVSPSSISALRPTANSSTR